ncbi:histone deacetylase [soil metagenome]
MCSLFLKFMVKIAFDPTFQLSLPENHRFPMLKYDLIPRQLLHEGIIDSSYLFKPKPVTRSIAALVHTEKYLDKLLNLELSPSEIRRSGFPLSKELIEREFLLAGGTVDCTDFALEYGIALNVAGGTHHAFKDQAEGFCLLNDCAIAAAALLTSGKAKKILIVDLDVHQGNGTASIFKDEPAVFTLSMHGAHNFPHHKEQSDLDIPLPDGTDDHMYHVLMDQYLLVVFREQNPDFVFYISGVDVLASDKLGRLKLSREGCRLRDEKVIRLCHEHKVPLVITMGGGYSEKINDIVTSHCDTFRIALSYYDV